MIRRNFSAGFDEGGDEVADADAVVILQGRAGVDGLVVDEGAVTALLVLDEVLAADADDLSVFAADRGDGDDDGALGVTAEDEAFSLKGDGLSLAGAFEDLERRHGSISRGANRCKERSPDEG
jgi:hypothetical protein